MPHFDDKTWEAILAHQDTELDKPATAKAIAAFEAKHDFVLPDAQNSLERHVNAAVRRMGVGV